MGILGWSSALVSAHACIECNRLGRKNCRASKRLANETGVKQPAGHACNLYPDARQLTVQTGECHLKEFVHYPAQNQQPTWLNKR